MSGAKSATQQPAATPSRCVSIRAPATSITSSIRSGGPGRGGRDAASGLGLTAEQLLKRLAYERLDYGPPVGEGSHSHIPEEGNTQMTMDAVALAGQQA